MAENQQRFSILPKIVNGGVAGIAGVTCTFPLDLVKTRLQKQNAGQRVYNSICDAFRKVRRTEGLKGMYRGAGVLVVLVTPEKAVKLAANDFFRFHLKDDKTNTLSVSRQALAGALAGLAQLVVTVPMELLKIQLQDLGRVAVVEAQLDAFTGKLKIPDTSARLLALDLVRSKGVLGLYRGLGITALRDVPFCTVYFTAFARLDALGPRKADGSGDAQFYWSFGSGLVAGSSSALVVTPFDVVKTRVQTVDKSGNADVRIGSVIANIWKREGPPAFFRGGACRMMAIAPLYAIIQGVYFLGVGEKLLGTEKCIKTV